MVYFFLQILSRTRELWGEGKASADCTILEAGRMKKQQHGQAFDSLNLIHLQERWIVNSNLQAIFK